MSYGLDTALGAKTAADTLDEYPEVLCPGPEPGDVVVNSMASDGNAYFWPTYESWHQYDGYLSAGSFASDGDSANWDFDAFPVAGEIVAHDIIVHYAQPDGDDPADLQGVYSCVEVPCEETPFSFSIDLRRLGLDGKTVLAIHYSYNLEDRFVPTTWCISHFRPDRLAGTFRLEYAGTRYEDTMPTTLWFAFELVFRAHFDERYDPDYVTNPYSWNSIGTPEALVSRSGSHYSVEYDRISRDQVWGAMLPDDTGGAE